jgi:pimeloyl-ACP methyl ester carboxylesterase
MALNTTAFSIMGVIIACLLLSCAGVPDYPRLSASREPRINDYISQNRKMTIGGKQYDVELGTIYVPENRRNLLSRFLEIPVKIIKSPSHSAIPIFYLTGGPGQTNLDFSPPSWLLDNYDMVFIGYRGVDGSVRLNMPEIGWAFSEMQDPLSKESIKIFAQAADSALTRIRNSGIDITAYTVMDVVDDLQAVREVLGYETINLLSGSYGTRLAYLFGIKYPTRVNRSLLLAVNPPGCCVWEPARMDEQLEHYAALWRADPAAAKKSADILITMKEVLASLPKDWSSIHVNPDKVRLMSFISLWCRGANSLPNAAQLFDAFIAAKNGDYSGLAMLSSFFDSVMPSVFVWGDTLLKAVSADFDPKRDYLTEMDPPGSVMGSPLSKFVWGAAQLMETVVPTIPEEYRTFRESDVSTLMISGSVDFSDPAENATRLLAYLKNGRQVILSEFGHVSDLWNLQPAAIQHLMLAYYRDGTVDDSLFRYAPMNFTPQTSFQSMARTGKWR